MEKRALILAVVAEQLLLCYNQQEWWCKWGECGVTRHFALLSMDWGSHWQGERKWICSSVCNALFGRNPAPAQSHKCLCPWGQPWFPLLQKLLGGRLWRAAQNQRPFWTKMNSSCSRWWGIPKECPRCCRSPQAGTEPLCRRSLLWVVSLLGTHLGGHAGSVVPLQTGTAVTRRGASCVWAQSAGNHWCDLRGLVYAGSAQWPAYCK